jgi:pyruvate,water dikinase
MIGATNATAMKAPDCHNLAGEGLFLLPVSSRRSPMSVMTSTTFIRWFADIGLDEIASVGGKNASLGELYRHLAAEGIRVPNGFAITADAYRAFLRESALDQEIHRLLDGLDTTDLADLRRRGAAVRHAILAAEIPADLAEEILTAYLTLGEGHGPIDVAVRSSATAEDLPDASFAGQQETYLNVQGRLALLDVCRRCFASLFTDRAISYRVDKGFDHFQVALSIGVQRMVRSDLGTSGVMFSIDTETGFPDVVLINAAYGLGENVVQGAVNPDEYYVHKPTLLAGYRPILKKSLGSKEFKLIYDIGGSRMTKNVPVAQEDRARFALNEDEILTLARWACRVEEYYSARRGQPTPMDMEWAKDGRTGELFLLQARPETVQSQKREDVLETYRLGEHAKRLVSGRAVGERIASGNVRVVRNVHEMEQVQPGEILVTDKTDPDWEPIMKRAGGIVTNRGGRTCHAAIVSRELGLPAIVGCVTATDDLRTGQAVTICCAEGEVGVVYEGKLPWTVDRVRISDLRRPRTAILMNVANPDEAFSQALIPNDGVGLARMEFIINDAIRIHPMALLRYDQLAGLGLPAQELNEIRHLTAGYEDKPQYFVDRLAEGVGTIAAAFYPKPVIVRMSDFKTNEYAHLLGGRPFEPLEENPMIGFRGASRYYDDRYREAFGLECRAMQKVREEMGLKNVKLMIPFCRTIEEGRRVQEVMASHGLKRGEQGLEILVMCEIPSNVFSAAEFASLFDGFSIGSNDLTQLILGVDRDSEIIAHLFSERDSAVSIAISSVIRVAKEMNTKIGICGQGPSDDLEFARFLVMQGIDSISLNPDAVLKTTLKILEIEEKLEEAPLDD